MVYKIKYKEDGSIDRFKVCLMLKASHKFRVFEETFSIIIKLTTIRLLISIAIGSKWIMK